MWKIKPEESKILEERGHLFDSQMCVTRTPLHFIVDCANQKNLIYVDVVKILKLPIMSHPQPYTIGLLSHGQDIHVIQQHRLSYNIKTFSNKALCDVVPLEVCDVLSEQPYMWKFYVVYESQPHSGVFTLGDKL